MMAALQSGAFISSLFPSNVRYGLYKRDPPGTAEGAQKNCLKKNKVTDADEDEEDNLDATITRINSEDD